MKYLWIFAVAPVLVLSTDCPAGWTGYQNKCFFFSHTMETWSSASAVCQSFKSMLAEPKTTAEIGFLSGELQHFGIADIWVGITDIITENQWVYDSSLTPIEVNNWGPREPNGHSVENCVIMSGYFHGKFADVECHSPRKFICERAARIDGELIG
uniref:C-type lectin domain-containing protein n=2 Tax=Magallana gigas TaxID=29159 RepID=A0A8W8HR60_MAGGI